MGGEIGTTELWQMYKKVLFGKPKMNRPIARPKHEWDNNIKIVLKEEGCGLDLSV